MLWMGCKCVRNTNFLSEFDNIFPAVYTKEITSKLNQYRTIKTDTEIKMIELDEMYHYLSTKFKSIQVRSASGCQTRPNWLQTKLTTNRDGHRLDVGIKARSQKHIGIRGIIRKGDVIIKLVDCVGVFQWYKPVYDPALDEPNNTTRIEIIYHEWFHMSGKLIRSIMNSFLESLKKQTAVYQFCKHYYWNMLGNRDCY